MSHAQPETEAFRAFLRRVWENDVTPLLRGARTDQRAKSARVTGQVAAATGLFVDSLLGLKGRPFARFMTVMGSSLGAMLPDVWDWKWLRDAASERQRKVVEEQVQRRAAELPEEEALALFDLPPTATYEQFRTAWRREMQRWHPDKASDERSRAEHHIRFLAYQTARRRLEQAYEEGRLPKPPPA